MTSKIQVYTHKVQYYETDQMGVLHYSNYIRWFEEARSHYMEETDLTYAKFEASGITIPVRKVREEYKHPCYFSELIEIKVHFQNYSKVRFDASYAVSESTTQEIRCVGYSRYATLSQKDKIVSLVHSHPEIYSEISQFFI